MKNLVDKKHFDAASDFFYKLVLADESLKPYFAGVDTARWQRHQAEFLATVAGGPEYKGKSIEAAHKGLNTTEVAFRKVAHHLVATLDHFMVPEDIKQVMVNAAMSLRPQIVGK